MNSDIKRKKSSLRDAKTGEEEMTSKKNLDSLFLKISVRLSCEGRKCFKIESSSIPRKIRKEKVRTLPDEEVLRFNYRVALFLEFVTFLCDHSIKMAC